MAAYSIDKFGRVVIPKIFRDKLGLEPGAEVAIQMKDDALVIKRVHDDPALEWQDGVLVFTGEADVDWNSALRRDREARIRRSSGFEE